MVYEAPRLIEFLVYRIVYEVLVLKYCLEWLGYPSLVYVLN